MSNKLTFLMTSRNFEGEQQRVQWSIQSILNQECDSYQLLFLDLSPINHRFDLPQHDRLQIFTWPNCSLKDNWYMCYLRNWLALQAKTEHIVHVNADVLYDKKTAITILEHINDKGRNTLVQCRRRNCSETQYKKLHSFNNAMKLFKTCKKKDSHQPCGELQGMHRDVFINNGGYHNIIKNGELTMPIKIQQGRREDSYLWRKYNKSTVWIDKHISIVHMWHPLRPCTKDYGKALNFKNW